MLPAITAGIQTWWRDHLDNDVPTLYPGTHADTSSLDAWYELWIDAWTNPTRRPAQFEATTIAVTIHLFTRRPTNLARPLALAEAAAAVLQHQTVPLHDPDDSEHPLVGYAKFQEAQLRDLTRPLQPHAGDRLTHHVITLRARAESITPP